MSVMAALKVGRKRESPIWDFLEYNSVENKSKCLVVEAGDKICGTLLKGKNPTNLKVHLKSAHKNANQQFLDKLACRPPSPEKEARAGNVNTGKKPNTSSMIMDCFDRRPNSCWLVNTHEHQKREDALVNVFIETGMSTRLCESNAFKKFCTSLEPKFKTPGAARVNNLIGAKMDKAKQKLKDIIKEARMVTICVDCWSKRGLTASFMGVSACFYYPPGGQVHHALLNLHRMEHPHTGEAIALCLDQTLDEWGIREDKVLLIVTDNGSNIVKAVRLLGDRTNEMPCFAHTLQLALKDAMKHPNADSLITRARHLVSAVRKSSVANEALTKKCGKTLVRDCSTRWNSTFDMLRRLLEIRAELNQVLEELSMDTLLTSDWTKLEKLVKLLEPFAIHTDQLQNDSQSLSQVVPCLLNLEAHLMTTTAGKQLAQVLLKSLRERFSSILNPFSPQFDATPAAACPMDPSVSLVLQTPDTVPLERAAQSFVQKLATAQINPTASQDDVATATASQTATRSPPTILQKYRFLASRMEVNASLTNQPDVTTSLLTEINKYVEDVKHGVFNETPLQFWRSRMGVYPKLAPVALDLYGARGAVRLGKVLCIHIPIFLTAAREEEEEEEGGRWWKRMEQGLRGSLGWVYFILLFLF
uniref:DUF659 domain-containing protein n=1 Tax=Oryzias latipes TaxID=8090 RepID=A0A3P9J2Q6_ORYLA